MPADRTNPNGWFDDSHGCLILRKNSRRRRNCKFHGTLNIGSATRPTRLRKLGYWHPSPQDEQHGLSLFRIYGPSRGSTGKGGVTMNPHTDLRSFHAAAEGPLSLDNLSSRVQHCLRTSRYPELHHVSCHWHNETVVLSGHVSTFYMKQVAQTLIRGIDGVTRIDNRITVNSPAARFLPSPQPQIP
jgi:hypothetical protein